MIEKTNRTIRSIRIRERQAKKAEKYISLRDKLSKIEISVLVEDIDKLVKEMVGEK